MVNKMKAEASIERVIKKYLNQAPGEVLWKHKYLSEAIINLRLKYYGGQYCRS